MISSLWEDTKKFLSEKFYITVTPSSTENKIKNFSLHRYIIIATIIIVIISFGVLTCNYFYYKTKYQQTKTKFQEYKNNLSIEEIQEENNNLKKNLLVLSQNTEELRAEINKIKDSNQDIKSILGKETEGKNEIAEPDKEIMITSLLDYNKSVINQGVPMGGSELNLYYPKTNNLLTHIKGNITAVKANLENQKEIQNRLREDALEYKNEQQAMPTKWPLADNGNCYVSSDFGWRRDPISSQQEYHNGIDIAVWYNTPVIAAASGKVIFVGWNGGYGWSVEIEHGYGYSTYYAHLNKIKVDKGDRVDSGEMVGLSGNSGKSTGPHLHYEVRKNGIPKDPRKFIGR